MALLLLALSGTGADAGAAASPEPGLEAKRIIHLISELGAGAFEAREEAERELRAIGAEAVPALQKAAAGPDAEVRMRAGRLLHDIAWQLPAELAAQLGEFGRTFTPTYLAANGAKRVELLRELVRQAPEEATGYVVLGAREEPPGRERTEIVGLLGWCRTPAMLPGLLALTGDPDAACRQAAAGNLVYLADEAAMRRLTELIADPVPGVRQAALRSVAQRGRTARAALPAVIKALEDPTPEVQEAAAIAAGDLGDPSTVAHLWKLAESSGKTNQRWMAIAAIEQLAVRDDRKVAERLARILDDREPEVCVWALVALRNMRARSAAGRIAEFLDRPNLRGQFAGSAEAERSLERVRPVGAWALAWIGGPEQVPTLRRVLDQDDDRRVAGLAVGALFCLSASPSEERINALLSDSEGVVSGQTASELGHSGDQKWSRKLAEMAGAAKVGEDRKWLAGIRDADFRDPEAFRPAAEAIRPGDTYQWTQFLDRHALFPEIVELRKAEIAARSRIAYGWAEPCAALVRSGRAEEGMELLRKAAQWNPFDPIIHQALARALLECPRAEFRNPAEALKAVTRATETVDRYWSDYVTIMDLQAWACLRNGRKEEALRIADEVLEWVCPETHRPRGYFLARRSRILAASGRPDEAAKALESAASHAGLDPETAAELARAWCDLGKPERALAELRRMVDLVYPDLEVLRNDPDLAPARKDPAFPRLLERAEQLSEKLRTELTAAAQSARGKPGKGE